MAKKTQLKPFRFTATVMLFAKDADEAIDRFDKALDTINVRSERADRWLSKDPVEIEKRDEDQLYADVVKARPDKSKAPRKVRAKKAGKRRTK